MLLIKWFRGRKSTNYQAITKKRLTKFYIWKFLFNSNNELTEKHLY